MAGVIHDQTFEGMPAGAPPTAPWAGTGGYIVQVGGELRAVDHTTGSGRSLRIADDSNLATYTCSGVPDDGTGYQRLTYRVCIRKVTDYVIAAGNMRVLPSDPTTFYQSLVFSSNNGGNTGECVLFFRVTHQAAGSSVGLLDRNLTVVTPADPWIKIIFEATPTGRLTLKAQREDNGQWLQMDGTWGAAEVTALDWTTPGTPIAGAGEHSLILIRGSWDNYFAVDDVTYENTGVGPPVPGTISITTPAAQATVGLTSTAPSGGAAPIARQWHRSTASGFTPSGGTAIGGATGLTLNDSGLSPSTTYYYKVTYTDGAGITVTSAELAVATPAAIVPGTASASSAGGTAADLTATAATGGVAPIAVQWFRSTASGTLGSAIAGATSLTYRDLGLTPGTTYFYTCRYTQSVGGSADSVQVSTATTGGSVVGFYVLEKVMEYVPPGTAGKTAYFRVHKTDGTGGRIGLAPADVTLTYLRAGGTVQSVPLSALPSVGAAWAAGQFGQTDAANRPGEYRADLPDAAFASGAKSVEFYLKVPSGSIAESVSFSLELMPTNVIQVNGEPAHDGDEAILANVVSFNGTAFSGPYAPADVKATFGTTLTSVNVPTTGGGSGGGGLDAAGVRAALGLASANLDSQLGGLSAGQATIAGYIDTEVGAIQAAVSASSIRAALGLTSASLDSQLAGLSMAINTVDDFVDTEIAAIKAVTDKLSPMIVSGAFTASALVNSPAGSGGGGLDAAGVRAALGLASANLDSQLGGLSAGQATIAGYIDTEVGAIKAVTDRVGPMVGGDGAFTAPALAKAPNYSVAFPATAPAGWITSTTVTPGAIAPSAFSAPVPASIGATPAVNVMQVGGVAVSGGAVAARLTADGLDAVATDETGGIAGHGTFRGRLNALYERFFGENRHTGTAFETFKADGSLRTSQPVTKEGEDSWTMEAAR